MTVMVEHKLLPVKIVCAYVPPMGCPEQDKEAFCQLDDLLIERRARLSSPGFFLNGHVGNESQDLKSPREHGFGERDTEVERTLIVEGANNKRILKTQFRKPKNHFVTYSSQTLRDAGEGAPGKTKRGTQSPKKRGAGLRAFNKVSLKRSWCRSCGKK